MTISADATVRAEKSSDRLKKWAVALFFVSLFIPGYLRLGLRLDPYRIYFLVMAVPILLRLLSDRTIRFTLVDVFIFLAITWQSLGILVVHGRSEVVFAFSSFVQSGAGYLLGRVFVRNAEDFRYFFKCFLLLLLAYLPFALVEVIAHRRLLNTLFGTVLIQPDEPLSGQIRFGLLRARFIFQHSLSYGGFAAIGFAMAYYNYAHRFPRGILYSGFVGFMAMLSIASSALLTLGLQLGLMLYDRIFWWLRHRWIIALVLGGVVLLLFGPAILDFILGDLLFNPYSGDSRLLHYEFGLAELLRNPAFGVGLNPWGTPYWLSQNVDSFWLGVGLRSGIPAILFLHLAFVLHLGRVGYAKGLTEDERRLQTGYGISLASTVLMLHAVSFYHSSEVFLMAFCGAGAWFYNGLGTPSGLTRRNERQRQRSAGRQRRERPARTQPETRKEWAERQNLQERGRP